MSRRHTSKPRTQHLVRALVAALSIVLVVVAILPAMAFAQQTQIRDVDLEQRWQLLTYRDGPDPKAKLVPVPAGVGATLLLFGGDTARGEAACSTFDTGYDRTSNKGIFIFPTEPQYVECDPASLAFDEIFYQHLASTASVELDDSILTVEDAIGAPLMVFTRAEIDEDPTVARWNLARIGTADGAVEPVIVGLEPWIEFLRGGRIVGSTGCGSFLGSYAINEGTIAITDLRYRFLDTCTGGALRQAEQIVVTLDEIDGFEVLPAGLALRDANGVTRLALTPEIDLGRRTWTPTVIYSGSGKELRQGQELSTSAVQFDRDDAQGRTACRPFVAEGLRSGLALAVDADSIKWSDEKAKCPKGRTVDFADIERDFMDALKAASSHALRGSELELKDVNGNTLMRLEPQEPLVGTTWVVTTLGKDKLRKPIGDAPLTVTFDDLAGLVQGDTGALDGNVSNYFYQFYSTDQATRIDIEAINPKRDIEGRACQGKLAKSKACLQEQRFVGLLSAVDGYIVRPNDLWLLSGMRPVIKLVPEYIANAQAGA